VKTHDPRTFNRRGARAGAQSSPPCSFNSLIAAQNPLDFHYLNLSVNLSRQWGAPQIVGLANGRCDQENVIEQLKNGVNAMRMPVNDLVSNWAYMVMASLAWNLKAWYGLLTPNRERGLELVKMEFRRFLHAIILIPCQVVRTARRVIYRIIGYNSWLTDFFATFEKIAKFAGGCEQNK
jgi:hypothetical protein